MKHIIRKAVFSLTFASICLGSQAQQVNTLYFLENSPMRHYINPAFQPISNMYLSLPVVGWSSVWAGNNSLSLNDIVFNHQGQTMWFLNPEADPQRVFKRLPAILSSILTYS